MFRPHLHGICSPSVSPLKLIDGFIPSTKLDTCFTPLVRLFTPSLIHNSKRYPDFVHTSSFSNTISTFSYQFSPLFSIVSTIMNICRVCVQVNEISPPFLLLVACLIRRKPKYKIRAFCYSHHLLNHRVRVKICFNFIHPSTSWTAHQ